MGFSRIAAVIVFSAVFGAVKMAWAQDPPTVPPQPTVPPTAPAGPPPPPVLENTGKPIMLPYQCTDEGIVPPKRRWGRKRSRARSSSS